MVLCQWPMYLEPSGRQDTLEKNRVIDFIDLTSKHQYSFHAIITFSLFFMLLKRAAQSFEWSKSWRSNLVGGPGFLENFNTIPMAGQADRHPSSVKVDGTMFSYTYIYIDIHMCIYIYIILLYMYTYIPAESMASWLNLWGVAFPPATRQLSDLRSLGELAGLESTSFQIRESCDPFFLPRGLVTCASSRL